jgi:hypothetical protein
MTPLNTTLELYYVFTHKRFLSCRYSVIQALVFSVAVVHIFLLKQAVDLLLGQCIEHEHSSNPRSGIKPATGDLTSCLTKGVSIRH